MSTTNRIRETLRNHPALRSTLFALSTFSAGGTTIVIAENLIRGP